MNHIAWVHILIQEWFCHSYWHLEGFRTLKLCQTSYPQKVMFELIVQETWVLNFVMCFNFGNHIPIQNLLFHLPLPPPPETLGLTELFNNHLCHCSEHGKTWSPLFTASPFCCQWLWRSTVTRQMTHPSAGIQFETHRAGTVLACRTGTGCGKLHNYFKVAWDYCSQPPDNLCLEEKRGKPDVSSYGLRVLCIGLLKICCHPTQTHDAWPGIMTVGL